MLYNVTFTLHSFRQNAKMMKTSLKVGLIKTWITISSFKKLKNLQNLQFPAHQQPRHRVHLEFEQQCSECC